MVTRTEVVMGDTDNTTTYRDTFVCHGKTKDTRKQRYFRNRVKVIRLESKLSTVSNPWTALSTHLKMLISLGMLLRY